MNKRKITVGIIVLIVILLFLLTQCGKKKEIEHNRNYEQELLQEMKQDEANLISLYERSDICSEEWMEEFKEISLKFQNYSYLGSEEEIMSFLKEYKEYGKELYYLVVIIDEENYEESIEVLKALQIVAGENEKELNQLYEKYN